MCATPHSAASFGVQRETSRQETPAVSCAPAVVTDECRSKSTGTTNTFAADIKTCEMQVALSGCRQITQCTFKCRARSTAHRQKCSDSNSKKCGRPLCLAWGPGGKPGGWESPTGNRQEAPSRNGEVQAIFASAGPDSFLPKAFPGGRGRGEAGESSGSKRQGTRHKQGSACNSRVSHVACFREGARRRQR